MAKWNHEEALKLAFSKPVTGRVIAARLHVRHCGTCSQAVEGLLKDIDAAEPRILVLLEWAKEAINEAAETLAVGELQTVPILGEEQTVWHGQLSYRSKDLHVEIETEMALSSEDQPRSITVSVNLSDLAGQPVDRTSVDFCDARGVAMETGVTDRQGRVSFSSHEGERFTAEGTLDAAVVFFLELILGDEKASWQVAMNQGNVDVTAGTIGS